MGHFELVGEIGAPGCCELIVRLIEALAWPTVVVIALALVKPQRLLDKLIADGGQVAAGGVSVSVPAKIADVADQVGEKQVGVEEQKLAKEAEAAQALDNPETLYERIMNAWSELSLAMWNLLHSRTGEETSLRAPRQLIERLLVNGLINRKTAEELQQLLDIRNTVKRNGVSGFETQELTEEDTLKYAASAAALQKTYFS